MHLQHSSKRFVLTFFVSVLLFCFEAVSAYGQSDWYYNKPIKSVTFTGLDNVKASDLEGVTSPFIGRLFSDDIFLDLINRVFALNYFEEVNPEAVPGDSNANSVIININVKEYPVLHRITFKGNTRVKSASLKEAISMKEKDIYDDSRRLLDERALRDYYIEKGYTSVDITSSFVTGPKGIEVIYDIKEGQQTIVKEIAFTGNLVVSSKTLKGKISLKEIGLFNKGEFQEATVEQDRKIIEQYYKDRGYVDVRAEYPVITHNFNQEKQRDELRIEYSITEGSRYRFGGVTFEGNHVFTSEELGALVKLKEGDIYNETSYQASYVAVQSKYMENGYTYNQFASQVTKNADEKVISYTIIIMENSRSHIEEIVIRGNTKTKENVIRREIPIESGDIYSNEKLYTAMRNLYNLQYFSSIVPEVTPGSENNLIDVVFNVEEQSTTTLTFGLTFSGVSDPEALPIALTFSLQDSNFFGTGKSVSVNSALSTDEQSIGVSYGENWLFGKPISFSVSASYTHGNETAYRNKYNPDGTYSDDLYYLQYEENIMSLGLSVGRRWTPNFAILTLSGGISGSLINYVYDNTLFTPVDTTVSDYANNWEPKNSIWSQFSMDGRNVSYDPSTGWFASQRFTWYGLFPREWFDDKWGEAQFYLKSDTKVEKYFTLLDWAVTESWNLKLVLAGYSGLSYEFPVFGKTIKSSNLLYIDGMFYGRGWSVYGSSEGRGNVLWNNTVELHVPVVPNILALDYFFDASMVYNTQSSDYNYITGFGDKNNWYFSFGPDLRICLQQFPIRLMWAHKFRFGDDGAKWCYSDGSTADNFWKSGSFVLSFTMSNK